MGPIAFVRKWTLPCAMATGMAVYFLFSMEGPLEPIGEAVGPRLTEWLPALIFVMFYFTFCNMRVVEMRPRAWHFWLQLMVVGLSALLAGAMALVDDTEARLVLEGVFICVMCPTATAAPILTEKLGGSMESLTMYTLIANTVCSLSIPVLFPLVERDADITFAVAFLAIFRRLAVVLVVPLCLAQATRRLLPGFTRRINSARDIPFYLWALALCVVMGMTAHNIATATVSGPLLALMVAVPLPATLVLFALGKWVGGRYGESISAGQALGQKNTVVGIWLTVNFLNPTAAIAPCAYVIWQNIVNSWQLWYKDKYGRLRW